MRAVVLALTVAFVASQQINLVPEFAQGNTYVYKYEAVLWSGLPQEDLAKAGMKISSKVHLSAVAENTYLMKFMDPQLYEYAGVWPRDEFVLATKLTSAMAAQLQIPIKFEYANGVVGKVYAPERVSPAIMNLYRGILNILQLNLKKTQNIYELQEAGAQGVCKTQYVIREDAKSNQFTVTKSKDLSQCQERIIRDAGLAYSEECTECTKNVKSLTETATYNYVMKPSAAGVLISEATVEEVHQYSPFNEAHGAAQMEARQTLAFVDIEKTPVVASQGEYLSRGSLQYEFTDEDLQMPIHLLKVEDAPAQITELLKHLAEHNKDTVHEHAPLKFVELIQLLRVAREEHIEAIWTQFKDEPVYRRWLLDSLSSVGTSTCFRVIKEKFLNGECSIPEFIQALVVALQKLMADQETIELIASLATHEKISTIPALREVIMLGYGSMIAKYCAASSTCSADLLRPIHDMTAEAVSKNDINEITLCLKVMGNAGHPASLKPIMKLLPVQRNADAAHPLRVQVDAILALRNIAKKEPKSVQQVVLQLFMDRSLHPEVRMVACIVLFETKPSVALMSSLVGSLRTEPNMQVASFASSQIKSLTRITAPDMARVAGAANVACTLMSRKLDRLNFRYSRTFQADYYHSPLMAGAAGSAYLINDAATILPKAVVAKARAYLAGAAADVVEVGVRTEGIREAILKTDADKSNDRITNIKRTLRALTNWKALPTNQPLASAYIKLFGQEVAFANIDRNLLEQAMELASGPRPRELLKNALTALQKGWALQFSKPMFTTEARRILPTAVGVPMELGLYKAAVAATSVNVRTTITPPLPEQLETFTLEQLRRTDVQLHVEARPSLAIQTFAVMGVSTDFIQAAVMTNGKVQITVPGKVAARADIQKGNYKMEVLPVEVPERFATVSLETHVVVRNTEDLTAEKRIPLVPELSVQNSQAAPADYWASDIDEREMPSEAQWRAAAPLQATICHSVPYVGIKGCVEVHSRNAASIRNEPLYYIIGQHSAYVTIQRDDSSTIERLEVEVQTGPRAAERLLKQISLIDEESPEGKAFLQKLREILETDKRNATSSSESSSSRSSSSKSSSSSQSKSSSSSQSKSSSSSQSKSSSSSQSNSNSSSSSSSSSSMSMDTKTSNVQETFRTYHKDQYQTPQVNVNAVSSGSAASSFEEIHKRSPYLGNSIPPVLAVIARAVRKDQEDFGYQLVAFLDQSTARVQLVVTSISESDNWKMCADGILLSKHKATTRLSWGSECKQYTLTAKVEAGVLGEFPAARLEVEWERLPRMVTTYSKKLSQYIPWVSHHMGLLWKKSQNCGKEVELTVAIPSQNTLNIRIRMPEMTVSRNDVSLPLDVPIKPDGSLSVQLDDDSLFRAQNYIYDQVTAKCHMHQDTIRTFNNRRYKNEMPVSCYQVLAQDCSEELKFIVLLKKDDETEQNHVTIKLADIDVTLYTSGSDAKVKVNGMEVPMSSLPYQHSSDSIQIRQKAGGLSLYAPSHGLQEVHFADGHCKIQVVDWMRGQTCGLCGKADGETRQEYRTPSGYVTESSVSFAHSWVLPAESCRDASKCRMKLESVKLEKEAVIDGRQSKCYSVEPVLRCLSGCSPVRKTPVQVGYHCLPTDSNLNMSDGVYGKSVDLRETTEAHVACRCSEQCA